MLKADTTAATKLALIEDFDRVLGLDLVPAARRALESEKAAADAASSDPFVAEIEAKISRSTCPRQAAHSSAPWAATLRRSLTRPA